MRRVRAKPDMPGEKLKAQSSKLKGSSNAQVPKSPGSSRLRGPTELRGFGLDGSRPQRLLGLGGLKFFLSFGLWASGSLAGSKLKVQGRFHCQKPRCTSCSPDSVPQGVFDLLRA